MPVIPEGLEFFNPRPISAKDGVRHAPSSSRQKTCPNLTIRLGAKALRILISNGRATGVEYMDSASGAVKVAHGGTVILAAGSFVSAQLLLLSGVGPAKDLESLGITVNTNLPAVGEGLQDHNDVRIGFETTGNYGYSNQDRGLQMLWNGLQYMSNRSGPVTSTGSEVTAFLNPTDLASAPTIQFYCLGKLSGHRGKAPNGITLVANLIAPASRGKVSLRSSNPADLPLVDPRWLTESADLEHLCAGSELLMELADATPMRRLIARCVPFAGKPSKTELTEFIRNVTGTNWHPVGTCRMGLPTDPATVVDPQLRVLGIDNLRVFDGSVMPHIIGANTNAPIMAIADRGVDILMNKIQLPQKRPRDGRLSTQEIKPLHQGQSHENI